MKNEEIKKVLELHSIFVESGGTRGEGANLWGAVGNGREIKSIQAFCYPIAYTSTHMFIGCEGHTIKDWANFTSDEIFKMDGDKATVFWNENKELILWLISKNPADSATTESKK